VLAAVVPLSWDIWEIENHKNRLEPETKTKEKK
jgi:hypothetical protein